MVIVDIVLVGMGNVGRSFLRIAQSQAELLARRHDLTLRFVGAVDSGGAVTNADGLDPVALLIAKFEGRSVATLPGGRAGVGAAELAGDLAYDILLESTPVNLQTGEPGLSAALTALGAGRHVVIANKGPLALAYQQLAALSDLTPGAADRPALRFSAAVGGALPTINLGRRDLACANVTKIEAVLNGTTQGILRMMETGTEYADALAEMQRRGIAETDPTLDVDGWDSASKMVILSNAILGRPATIADVSVTGIGALTAADLAAARARGESIVLLGLATPGDGVAPPVLRVAPAALPLTHPLARMSEQEMGIVYHTDISGILTATSYEGDATPTAAAMLRDVIDIVGPATPPETA